MHRAPELIDDCELADHTECTPGEAATGKPTGRRKFIFLGALAAATAAVAPGTAKAQGVTNAELLKRKFPGKPKTHTFPTVEPLALVAPPGAWSSPGLRLVRRATYGITVNEAFRVQAIGYQAWLNEQVYYTRINDVISNAFVATTYPLLSQTPEQLAALDFGVVVNQLREAAIYRAAFSRRQLYERMVELWSDHFNIAIDKVGYLKLVDDRDVIRAHAMGKFPDMVMASAKSPAMLAYLDQNLSRVGRPNENYARELMELHTLGVDGGYSQQDVVELSRVLTGWNLNGAGRFVFRPQDHDWGAKTVMGVTIPAGSPTLGAEGIREGEQIIRMLVQHPNTERFIARKILQWLLTPEPTETQIRTIASVYRATGGDIKLMVRATLNSGWLPAAPAKFKRPFHLLVSGLRALNPSVTGMNTVRGQLDAMGHQLHAWETPDGYPDKIEYWAGNIITRWSFATFLSTRNDATVSINMVPFTGNAVSITDGLNTELFGGEMDNQTRSALISYLGAGAPTTTRIREGIALAMSSAGFQWY